MTKDEYLSQAWERQKKESCISDTDYQHFFYEALFKNGFNAACEYYRNHVLEINDYEQGNAENLQAAD